MTIAHICFHVAMLGPPMISIPGSARAAGRETPGSCLVSNWQGRDAEGSLSVDVAARGLGK